MSEHNFGALRGAVLAASVRHTWAEAVQEWQMASVEEDPRGTGICQCGKTNLVYLFTIYNRLTQRELFPIGSSCIEYFGVEELDLDVGSLRRLLDLKAAYAAGRRVELTSEYFSRALLADLWESGAFPPNEYNHQNGDNDYRFLLNLFNQRHEFTTGEMKKVWVLLNNIIQPFVLNDERLSPRR